MKTAYITGGTKGIGYAIAQRLVKEGWQVCITGRNTNQVTKAVDDLNKIVSGKAMGMACDVRNIEEQTEVVRKIMASFGQLDLLVANAGIGHFASIEDLNPEQWKETINTNLTGVFYSIKARLQALKESKGYIITIASLAGTNFFAGGSAYNASKFGLVGFTQAVMLDLRKHGIKVSTIMPGSVATYFNGHSPSPDDAWKIQPEDIAELVWDTLKMNPRTLPSKIEVRPSMPPNG